MTDVFLGALSPLLMLFLCILAGFILRKINVLSDNAATVLSKCETYLFVPALSFANFSKYCTAASLRENAHLVLYSLLALFAYATPLGLNTVVFPAAYGGDTKPGAGMAMVSHVLCVLTIPLMYGLLSLIG